MAYIDFIITAAACLAAGYGLRIFQELSRGGKLL